MKRFLFLYLALLLIAPRMRAEPVDYVNVLMGTDSSRDFSAGNTYPAIALPWGMNAWTPVTGKMGSGWQYTYNARIIYGFKRTNGHRGSHIRQRLPHPIIIRSIWLNGMSWRKSCQPRGRHASDSLFLKLSRQILWSMHSMGRRESM